MPSVRPLLPAAPIALALALGVTSCALKTPPDAAAIKAEALPALATPGQWKGLPAAPGQVAGDWVAGFHDDQLNAAVTEAIANNADLRVGEARVEQAMLYAKLAGARLYPSADLLARGGGKMSGDNSGLAGALLSITWEVDLWGRVRYGAAAAKADALSAQADFTYARQSIAAVVARNWFLATEAALQAEVARATIREGEELVRLAETRARVGTGNDEDIYVARASVGGSSCSWGGIRPRPRL
jgi:multidrug efflux system outer membrane protein